MRMRLYLLSIWSMMDPIYFCLSRLNYPVQPLQQKNVFRIRVTRYKGRNVMLSDGTEIKKNDLMVKIHLHNVQLLKELAGINSELKKGKFIYRQVEHSLPYLANYILNHKQSEQIKGIFGITTLNRGVTRLGFEPVPLSSNMYKWFKCLTSHPIFLMSTSRPLRMFLKISVPKYLFMSKDHLLNKYRTICNEISSF